MNELLELLRSESPATLLTFWHANGKLAARLPEVAFLFGVPQRAEHHPEIDTGVHVALCLEMARVLKASEAARFAVLLHDLGKALTPAEELPMHMNHEHRGLAPVVAVCDRLAVPYYWRKLALLVCEYHLHAHRAFEMRSKSMLKLLSETGLETDTTMLDDFLVACEADKRGRLGKENAAYLQGAYMRQAAQALQGLYMPPGVAIQGRASHDLYTARLNAVRQAALPFRQAIEAAKAPQGLTQSC